jgi:hypothetical protein
MNAGFNANGNPITLAQYRTLTLTRPITDRQLGETSEAKRSLDAAISAHFTEPDSPVPDRHNWGPPDAPAIDRRGPRNHHATRTPPDGPTRPAEPRTNPVRPRRTPETSESHTA